MAGRRHLPHHPARRPVYRVAGGFPFPLRSWASYGGLQASTTVDRWAVDKRHPLARLLRAPQDGTQLIGLPSGDAWLVTAGSRTPAAPGAGAVAIEDSSLASLPTTAPAPPEVPTPQARDVSDTCGPARAPRFTDTGASPHEDTIDCVAEWGITKGTTPTTYDPSPP